MLAALKKIVARKARMLQRISNGVGHREPEALT